MNFIEMTEDFDMQLTKKQLLGILAAMVGGHNMIMYGAPGCGKTKIGQELKFLKPSLNNKDKESCDKIYSRAGYPVRNDNDAPFRMPHQTACIEGVFGGGPNCNPGEISFAHKGILFLDEAAEFSSSVLQMLRVPIDNKSIILSRAGRSTVYPADLQLVMATNPCPCGNYGVPDRICLCSKRGIDQYWRKFGALLYRVPIKLDFSSNDEKKSYKVSYLREIISHGCAFQHKRYGKDASHFTNEDLEKYCDTGDYYFHGDPNPIEIRNMKLVVRTLSDLEGKKDITKENLELAESLCKKMFTDIDW